MTSFQDYMNSGNGWLFVPAAVALGALHGLEPGHSKTMMAAFIISIRGTVTQAVLLGLSATISHTGIIWALALIGLAYSSHLDVEALEPYFQMGAGAIIIAMAAWMFFRVRSAKFEHSHAHDHGPHGGMLVREHHGRIEISIFETATPPEFRLYFYDHSGKPISPPNAAAIHLKTIRPDKTTQLFEFVQDGTFLRSTTTIPEPHEFSVVMTESHGAHSHSYAVEFMEHDHDHDHQHRHDHEGTGLDLGAVDFEDAHQRAHALELQQRFANRQVTTPQIILFGLTGGLIPCPSALAVLLVCLQLKKFALGFSIVMAFSLGLAITLVSVGTAAALSVRHVAKRFAWFGKFAENAPYASAAFMTAIGLFIGVEGLKHVLH